MIPVQKVWLYIVRGKSARAALLVFTHTHVDAGIQIPAGTVEPDEDLEHAAHREPLEESGVHTTRLTQIGECKRTYEGETIYANWFAGFAANDLPDEWLHHVTGSGNDNGMYFRCYWLPHEEWNKLYGDFKIAYPQLEEFITREFSMEIK